MNSSPGIIYVLLRHSGARASANPESLNQSALDSGLAASRRPGMTTSISSYRLVHGDELGAIRKRRFDLNVVDHLGDPIHALRTGDNLRAGLHQIGHRAAVARALDDEIGNDGDGLRVVELDAALQPPSRHHRGH